MYYWFGGLMGFSLDSLMENAALFPPCQYFSWNYMESKGLNGNSLWVKHWFNVDVLAGYVGFLLESVRQLNA